MSEELSSPADFDEDPPDKKLDAGIIKTLASAIYKRRPILGKILERHKDMNLYEYASHFMDVKRNDALKKRQEELFAIVFDLLSKRLGENIADEVAKQLRFIPLVSTADHHAPITHPFWVNSNIISALPYPEYKEYGMKYLVVFSFSSVSLNNSSGFPRGIIITQTEDGRFVTLPIYPDRIKMAPCYLAEAFTKDHLKNARSLLAAYDIPDNYKEKTKEIMEEIFESPEVLKANDAVSQITIINYHLWQKYFKPTKPQIPRLIYLDIESIVSELLLRHHLGNGSFLSRIIFDPETRNLMLKFFNNIPGAFSLEEKTGTYLFWTVDPKMHRVRLKLEANALVSYDNTYKFELTPEAIKKAILEKKIFPSMLLNYLAVSLYYGMKCLGGFSQVHDLTVSKEAWMNLLKEIGEEEEMKVIAKVQTRELGGDGLVLAYVERPHGIIPATGIDILTEINGVSFPEMIEFSKKVNLGELMEPLLPEIYRVLYASYERDSMLSEVTPAQILKISSVGEKVKGMVS